MEETIVQQDVQLDKESLEAKRVAEVSVKIIKKQLFRWLSKDTQKKVEHFLRFYHQEDRLTLLDAMMTYTMTGKKAKLEKPVPQEKLGILNLLLSLQHRKIKMLM